MMISAALRRQSRPLARISRDFVILKRPLFALGVGLTILLATIAVTQQGTSYHQELLPNIENIKK
jgi:hypothetical protein